MVLFFGLVFSVSLSLKIFLPLALAISTYTAISFLYIFYEG